MSTNCHRNWKFPCFPFHVVTETTQQHLSVSKNGQTCTSAANTPGSVLVNYQFSFVFISFFSHWCSILKKGVVSHTPLTVLRFECVIHIHKEQKKRTVILGAKLTYFRSTSQEQSHQACSPSESLHCFRIKTNNFSSHYFKISNTAKETDPCLCSPNIEKIFLLTLSFQEQQHCIRQCCLQSHQGGSEDRKRAENNVVMCHFAEDSNSCSHIALTGGK